MHLGNHYCDPRLVALYDLGCGTGLLSEADLRATFANVNAVLAPNGQFVFESRTFPGNDLSCRPLNPLKKCKQRLLKRCSGLSIQAV